MKKMAEDVKLKFLKDFKTYEKEGKQYIEDWDIELSTDKKKINQIVTEKFLYFLSKAREDSLSKEESTQWRKMVKYVDYQQYCFDVSEPRYVEGQLISKSETSRVEYIPGGVEFMDKNISEKLNNYLEEGEFFSAYIKFGKDGEAVSISDLEKKCRV